MSTSTIKRRIGRVVQLAAVTAVAHSLIALPAPASARETSQQLTPPVAKASCGGATCDGHDPQVSGCNDAVTLRTRVTYYYAGESDVVHDAPNWRNTWDLRYSANCRASWTRVSAKELRWARGGVLSYSMDLDLGVWAQANNIHGTYIYSHHAASRTYNLQRTADLRTRTFWTPMAADTAATHVRSCYRDYMSNDCTPYVN